MATNTTRILVTNDDGYDAPGLQALAGALDRLGEVIVVAPDREQSAASHALTLHRPLRLRRVAEGRYRVDGTPTDCVHLAVDRLTGGRLPDLVVSGINRGLNVGDDLTYSGTVAGAIEGTLLHVPSLAFSAATDENGLADYGAAAAFATSLCAEVLERGLAPGLLLNVNVPRGRPRGVRVTRQGTRSYRARSEERRDPKGRSYYWFTEADVTPTGESDGDHAAIRDGYVSVTPLHTDLTHEPSLDPLAHWPMEIPGVDR